jgi:hypothetical protein
METITRQEYFDVFMSYRRDGGSAIATLLKEKLRADPNLRIFLDVEEIGSGDWAERIESSLINSSNFLFLLTPGSLKRCFSDPGNDIVFREIQKACELRSYCESTPEKGSAENRFRIIPVFLGERVEALCEEYQLSHSHVVDVIRALVRHNGINLNDASSIDSELTRLGKTMLLKRTGKFAGTLVEKALSQSGGQFDEKGVQDLEELFASYLQMFDTFEYGQVRDALQPLVHNRLMKVLEPNGSAKFDDKLKSFKLGALKAACATLVHSTASHGSRLRVVNNTERWLRGEEVNAFASSNKDAEIIDRSFRVSNYFTEFITKSKTITRAKLSEVIRSRTGTGPRVDFHFFFPTNWVKYQAIIDELFERLTYREICLDFLKKNWLALQKEPVSKLTLVERKNRKALLINLQKFIWNRIQEDYSPRIGDLSKNASIDTYIIAIESFMVYGEGFEFCDADCKQLLVQEEPDAELLDENELELQTDEKENDDEIYVSSIPLDNSVE